MCRTLGSGLGFFIAFAAALGLEVRADAIQMTVTGNAGFGSVNYTEVLSNSILDTGYAEPTLGSRTVGPFAAGSIDAPISLTIGLSDLNAPASQSLTLSLSGSLTGQFIPYNLNNGDPTVMGSGRINTITISGQDTATGQLLSTTVQGPNGTLSSAALAQLASISSIPQSLLSMFTTPSLYHVDPFMGGGTQGIYYGELAISPPSPVAEVPAPEPAPIAILGFATIAYLFKRVRSASKGSGSKDSSIT